MTIGESLFFVLMLIDVTALGACVGYICGEQA